MKHVIKSLTGRILHQGEAPTFKAFVRRLVTERKSLAHAALPKIDLSGIRLEGADFSNAYMPGADLFGSNLKGANLSGSGLERANLSWTDLRDADLRYANLTLVRLENAKLICTNLSGAVLTGTSLQGSSLVGANISGATFRSTVLCETKGIRYAQAAFDTHGISGRLLTAVAMPEGVRFFCGCFSGTAQELVEFIQKDNPAYKPSRMAAFKFVWTQIAQSTAQE